MEQTALELPQTDSGTREQVMKDTVQRVSYPMRRRVLDAMLHDEATRHCVDIMERIRLRRAAGARR